MAESKSIIPEFMTNNPDDTFSIIMPIRLKVDKTDYSKSHFQVVVKNITKNEVFEYELSPEILFTHYPITKVFKNGKKIILNKYDKDHIPFMKINEKTFHIEPSQLKSCYLKDILSEVNIVSLVGWKRKFLSNTKFINCYILEHDFRSIIIPHYTVALYYYYRSTLFRELVLSSKAKIEELVVDTTCKSDLATITLTKPLGNVYAALLHRFVSQETARNGFDDITRMISSYLKTVKEREGREVDTVPIKAKFPTKENFNIEARFSVVKNIDTDKEFYFIHEIINDDSPIGFKHLTKYLQKDENIIEINDIENLPILQQEEPAEVTEILKRLAASRRLTQKQIKKDSKNRCGSLKNVDFEEKEITNETIKTLLKIVEETSSTEKFDQSLTESSSSDKEKIRKITVSNHFEEDNKNIKPNIEIINFEKFNQYLNFFEEQNIIKIENLQINKPEYLPKLIDQDTKEINKNCFMYGKVRKHITSTFKYKQFYVGLLELENRRKSSTSTWIIYSTKPITNLILHMFLEHYFEEKLSINEIKNKYKKDSTFRFKTQNHTHIEILEKKDLVFWLTRLIGKVII